MDLSRFLWPQALVDAAIGSTAAGLFQPTAECRRRGSSKPLMYWKMASRASRRVCHDPRQIGSALIVLKNVSTAELSRQLPLPLVDTRKPCWRNGF